MRFLTRRSTSCQSLEEPAQTGHIVDTRETPFMLSTRRLLLTASISPLIRPAAAAPRRSLTFAAFGGLFQELYEPAIVEPYGHARGETEVFYFPVRSSSQTLATLRRQRDQPELDVVLLDLASARAATDEGLLEPMTPGSMPVLADLAPAATFPGVAGRALYTEPLVMLFDAARVRPPASWKILWGGLDERSIAMPAPPDSVGIAFTIVAGRLFGGGNEKQVAENGVTAINELARGVVTWDPAPDIYHFVGDGNAKLGVGWNMPAQVYSDVMGGRLGVAFPAEGTISRVTTIGLVKGAPQPDAARAFIAYLLGADAQKIMVERMFLGPVNARARYIEGALQRTANTPERAARAMPIDWLSVNTMREDIIRRWRAIVPGAG
jgi:putative spermidine/putrescine transport system substrate-binding protein